MPITLDALKQKAIAKGYNLSGDKFVLRDWPIIQGFLAFEYNIQAEYRATIRDLASGANSIFDPSFRFVNKTDEQPVAGEYTYGTIHVHSGLNLHTTETVTVKSNAKVEVVVDGEWVEVTEFPVEYSTQDIEIPFRFVPQQTGNSIVFSSPTFTSTYLFNAAPFESENETPAICGEAVCGLTIVGDEE